jgi:hypothetical protein
LGEEGNGGILKRLPPSFFSEESAAYAAYAHIRQRGDGEEGERRRPNS